MLMYAGCSFCCYTPNRKLGYLVGLFVQTEVCTVVSAGKWVLNMKAVLDILNHI